MAYVPTPLPSGQVDLATYLLGELDRISLELQNISDGNGHRLWNVEPPRPREGMVITVDGTSWTPGGGAGVYHFTGGTWVKL